MQRLTPLEIGETYHVFNRGAHKQPIFINDEDYKRFQISMHLANHGEPVLVRDVLEVKKYREPFSGYPVDKSLVDVLAYCLMPNHFHLVLRQKSEQGVTRFMRKVCVGYSMYFNLKHEHSGTLFQGRFKSSHVNTDPYFKWIFSYVHLNPISIVDSEWKEKGIANPSKTTAFLRNYPYSSYWDYYTGERPERAILSYNEGVEYIDTQNNLQELLAEYESGRVLYPTYAAVDKARK